jgi:hypothetical protein
MLSLAKPQAIENIDDLLFELRPGTGHIKAAFLAWPKGIQLRWSDELPLRQGLDLYGVLYWRISLIAVLQEKARRASESERAYIPVRDQGFRTA